MFLIRLYSFTFGKLLDPRIPQFQRNLGILILDPAKCSIFSEIVVMGEHTKPQHGNNNLFKPIPVRISRCHKKGLRHGRLAGTSPWQDQKKISFQYTSDTIHRSFQAFLNTYGFEEIGQHRKFPERQAALYHDICSNYYHNYFL